MTAGRIDMASVSRVLQPLAQRVGGWVEPVREQAAKVNRPSVYPLRRPAGIRTDPSLAAHKRRTRDLPLDCYRESCKCSSHTGSFATTRGCAAMYPQDVIRHCPFSGLDGSAAAKRPVSVRAHTLCDKPSPGTANSQTSLQPERHGAEANRRPNLAATSDYLEQDQQKQDPLIDD